MPNHNDQNDKKEKKGFANLHYPGMKADPKETGQGKIEIDARARWRFEAQIESIGEQAQAKLLSSSVLVLAANALGVRIAKKLIGTGIGRVGIFGEEPATGAHEAIVTDEVPGAIATLSKWAKAEAPWMSFEPFSGESIDRRLIDIARGFDILVSTAGLEHAQDSLKICQDEDVASQLQALVACHVAGREAWITALPKAEFSATKHSFPSLHASQGLYFPMMDMAAARVAALIVDLLTASPKKVTESLSL